MKRTLTQLRAAWRLARVALHLAGGAVTVLCVYPLAARPLRLALKRRWSCQLLAMFGVRVRTRGAAAGTMRVANHVSWLDIFVINAVTPAAFVAKDDVRAWPLIGWLCANTETVFIRRASRRAAHETARELAARLAAGIDVVAFPEGTTGDGRKVLPFHGALLHGAIETGATVQPMALTYADVTGAPAQAPVYCGDTGLLQSMWRIALADGLTAHLDYLTARSAAGAERRALAAALESAIAAATSAQRTSSSLPSKCSTMAVQLSTQSPQLT